MDREEFIQNLYDNADDNLKSIYATQKENEVELLKHIAMILLTYTIVDSFLKLTNKEKSDNYYKLSNLILDMFANEIKSTNKGITDILSDVIKKDLNSYGLKSHKNEVLKIINEHYKGKHFSDRVWDNENQVSKMIHKEIKDFLDGKVNVNQIKSRIESQFNADKYNVKRLVDSEIGNVQSKISEKYFKDYDIKRVKYNATLCNTCEKCMSYHDKVFDIDDNRRPSLPQHPQCHCFYVQVNEVNQKLIMNLNLFGFDEKKELQKLIDSGDIDERNYNKCYTYFNNKFKQGVETPIGSVYNSKDRFVHIARRHSDMISINEIDNIVGTLRTPDIIIKTKDKFNNEATGYIKKIKNNELLTIVNNGIITSYYPSKNYLDKIKRGEVIWLKK